MANIYILHMGFTFTLHNSIIFDHVGSKFFELTQKFTQKLQIFGNFCKLFEKYELEKRYRGILFYSFQYIVT